ncbi:transposase [Phyllobacterium sp. TAF24]
MALTLDRLSVRNDLLLLSQACLTCGGANPTKSKVADAIRYAVSRQTALERFLEDGHIDMDTNIVKRAIRLQTITRKNALLSIVD